MSAIPAEQWPDFVRQQITVLVQKGIPEETAVRLYEMTGWKR